MGSSNSKRNNGVWCVLLVGFPLAAAARMPAGNAGEEGNVIPCHTKPDFEAYMALAKDTGKLVIIDFTASWCGPCRFMAPTFAEYAREFPGAMFLKVDVDELKDVAEVYNVQGMPTFLFIKDGQTVYTVVGVNKAEIHSKIVELIGSASA